MVRPEQDAFFLQVKVLSGQALEHPVADPCREERSNWSERGVESPLQVGSKQAGRNASERRGHDIVSAERRLRGPSRSFRGERSRQQAGSRTPAGPLRGCEAAARLDRRMRNRRDPPRQSASGKDRAYKAGWLKSCGAGRESEGVRSTREGAQHNALEGRDPALIGLVRR